MHTSISNLRILFASLILLTLLSSCENTPASTPDMSSASISELEQRAHLLVNDYRRSQGLPDLVFNETIAEQARVHSREMSGGNLNHDGFNQRVESIRNSMTLSSAAENVAFNLGFTDPADEAVRGWISSAPHRLNMEGGFNVTGIGADRKSDGSVYFTQIFVVRQ